MKSDNKHEIFAVNEDSSKWLKWKNLHWNKTQKQEIGVKHKLDVKQAKDLIDNNKRRIWSEETCQNIFFTSATTLI